MIEEPWETVLLSEKLNGAELACIAFMKNDAEAMKIAEKIKAKARLEIPIVEVDAGAMNQSTTFIKEKQKTTSKKTSPASCSTWSTLRMKNGRHLRLPDITTESSMRFIRRAPCLELFQERMLYADTSDTVPELGDTLTHGGTPLDAERQAALCL